MFIVENTNTAMSFDRFPEITDWSDDSYNILEASLFFNEDLNKIVQATSIAEVIAYHEGTIESFNESAFETVKNKLKQLWEKFKAFVLKVRDRFMAWVRKTFTSNDSFWSKYGNVIEDNYSKLAKKNPSFTCINFKDAVTEVGKLRKFSDEFTFDSIDIKDEENKQKVIDAYTDYMEKLDDIKKDLNEALSKEEEFKLSELQSDQKLTHMIPPKKDTYKKIIDFYKKGDTIMPGTDKIEREINAQEKAIEKWSRSKNRTSKDTELGDGHTVDTAKALYGAKFAKETLTCLLNALTTLSKKECNLCAKIGYEAVKLQNTKEEDVKEESASIDLLNKYLQRI